MQISPNKYKPISLKFARMLVFKVTLFNIKTLLDFIDALIHCLPEMKEDLIQKPDLDFDVELKTKVIK